MHELLKYAIKKGSLEAPEKSLVYWEFRFWPASKDITLRNQNKMMYENRNSLSREHREKFMAYLEYYQVPLGDFILYFADGTKYRLHPQANGHLKCILLSRQHVASHIWPGDTKSGGITDGKGTFRKRMLAMFISDNPNNPVGEPSCGGYLEPIPDHTLLDLPPGEAQPRDHMGIYFRPVVTGKSKGKPKPKPKAEADVDVEVATEVLLNAAALYHLVLEASPKRPRFWTSSVS